MCGICFICYYGDEINADHTNLLHCELLKNRGPDCSGTNTLTLGKNVRMVFSSYVLWIQGDQPAKQPYIDDLGNVLLWTGDILGNDEINEKKSDTVFIAESLSGCEDTEILRFMQSVKGPWSFVYYCQTNSTVYFGRDFFGRQSLLWSEQNGTDFALCSVCDSVGNFTEVPAFGIFYFQCEELFKGRLEINLILWNSLDIVSLQGAFDGIIDSDKTLVCPVQDQLNRALPQSDELKEIEEKIQSIISDETFGYVCHCYKDEIVKLTDLLTTSVKRRLKAPMRCVQCTYSDDKCQHAKFAVLFSGGLDSAVLALLLHRCLSEKEQIDLLNVAFSKAHPNDRVGKRGKVQVDFEVPDRISGRKTYEELCHLCPNRCWNFVEIDVTASRVKEKRMSRIRHLIFPQNSVLDDSIGCALWFAASGQGAVGGNAYTSMARVIFCGMGADEQLGGYVEHRRQFSKHGWMGLINEIAHEMLRISDRNMGRDNRVVCDTGRCPRFPYLDEDVVSYLNALPVWKKAFLALPRGLGEKILLRGVAFHLGLKTACSLPKKAIQFGSRIAKMENSGEKGSDVCSRLLIASS